jgi:cytochrome c
MDRKFFSLALSVLLLSCGGGNNAGGGNTSKDDISNNPVYQKGVALVGKNKCLTCHAINETITGPPYAEVANKYKDEPDSIVGHLARKIISGGNGVWGQVYMIPHPDLKMEDAEAMVRYILLLGKK